MGMRGPAQADKANVYIDVTRLDNKWFDSLSLFLSVIILGYNVFDAIKIETTKK